MAKHEKASFDFNFDSIVVEKKEEKDQNKVVKRKVIEVKPMSEEEAIIQMELLGHEFFMYKDSETMEAAVVYKRKDGRNFVCSPPLKGQESQDALWTALKAGFIDTVATDHCPFQSYEN